jgi:hypothetical protein
MENPYCPSKPIETANSFTELINECGAFLPATVVAVMNRWTHSEPHPASALRCPLIHRDSETFCIVALSPFAKALLSI